MTYFLLAILLLLTASSTSALELNELLDRHADALGGREKLARITTAEFAFEVSLGGMTGTSRAYFKAPDRFRFEIDLPIARYIQACAGDDCWMSDQSGLTHALGDEYKAALQTQIALAVGSYLDTAKFKGNIEVLDSNRTLDSVTCYVMQIEPADGLPVQLLINRESFLIEQIIMKTDLATMISRCSDYRSVDGIMVPFQTRESTEAGFVTGLNRVTEASFNQPIENSLFRDPRSGTPALSTISADSVVLPFEIWNNHCYVEVTLNDNRRHTFIFDSGAAGAAVNSRLTDSLPLKPLAQIEAHGVGGAQQSPAYLLEKLELGGLVFTDLPVFGIDLGAIESASGRTIDGIIGYDVLGRCIASVDYDASTLTLYNRDSAPREYWGHACDLMIDFRLPYVEAVVNDSIAGRFRIDTGSASSIDFNAPFVKTHALLDADRSGYREMKSIGIGGGSAGLIGILPSLDLCGYDLDSLTVSYSLAETGIFAGERTAGNIGAGVLKRFRVTFDYENEKLYLAPSERYELLNSVRNMLGISLTSSADTLVVDRVVPQSPADGLLDSGDRLLSLNETSLVGMVRPEAERMMTGSRGEQVTLQVLRAGKSLKVKLMLDNLY